MYYFLPKLMIYKMKNNSLNGKKFRIFQLLKDIPRRNFNELFKLTRTKDLQFLFNKNSGMTIRALN